MSNFLKSLFKGLNTALNFSTSFHPQTDGHTERVNQVLEDMLRMYVKEQLGKWEDYLHLVEFAYNNHYQALTRYSPCRRSKSTSVDLNEDRLSQPTKSMDRLSRLAD